MSRAGRTRRARCSSTSCGSWRARWPDEIAYRRPRRGRARSRSRSGTTRSNQAARWLVGQRRARRATGSRSTSPNEHCLRWIVAYAAVHKAGAVMVPANTRLVGRRSWSTILGHAEISAMFTCNDLLDSHARSRPACRRCESIVGADGPCDGALGWDDEIAQLDDGDVPGAARRRRHGRHHVHVGHDRAAEGRARPPPQRRDDAELRTALERRAAGCTARRCSRSRA